LLHIVLKGHTGQDEYDAMFERGLNCVARALVVGE